MIYTYGIAMQGTYHIKNNIPCQDYYHIVKCGEDMVVAAVADGLGSAEHSGIASEIAATISVNYCAEKIARLKDNTDDYLDILKESFILAQNSIEDKAQSKGHSIDQYDTTLTLAIMRNDTLFYGHSGDGGIIALTTEGLYEQITEQQRDEDACVFPLFFRDKWIFKRHDKRICSTLLSTDGMFDTFFPLYIKNEPVSIHVALARFFMDNRVLRIDESGEDAARVRIEGFIQNIPDEQVNDDKTIVVMVNTSIKSLLQAQEYYQEPNWAELKRKHDEGWRRLAYPHLFKEQDVEAVIESDLSNDDKITGDTEKPMHENERQAIPVEVTDGTAKSKENPVSTRGKNVFDKIIEAIMQK